MTWTNHFQIAYLSCILVWSFSFWMGSTGLGHRTKSCLGFAWWHSFVHVKKLCFIQPVVASLCQKESSLNF
jgi:hypothetical protein